jgi:hypothetical protein
MTKAKKPDVIIGGRTVSTSPVRASAVGITLRGWTGQIEFDLRNGRGWRVGTVRISLDGERLILVFESRTLAIIDRAVFRDWLVDPSTPLAVGRVIWSIQSGRTCLTFNGSLIYAVPERIVERLNTVV